VYLDVQDFIEATEKVGGVSYGRKAETGSRIYGDKNHPTIYSSG